MYYIDHFPKHSSVEDLVIITHHHYDHIRGPKKSFRGAILSSPMTHSLLQLPKTIPLDYYKTYQTTHYDITLIPNFHCAGSVGVVVHDKIHHETIGYTGDFRIWEQTPQAVDDFLHHFRHCHVLHYDDSFQHHTSYSTIPSLAETQRRLKHIIRDSSTPIYIDMNRTGLEILFKGWRHELTVSFHDSLSPAMKQVLPLLYPKEVCCGPHHIVFCHDKSLANIRPECTACYIDKCGAFPICFHNTPEELDYFLSRVPSHIKLQPCGFHIPLVKNNMTPPEKKQDES